MQPAAIDPPLTEALEMCVQTIVRLGMFAPIIVPVNLFRAIPEARTIPHLHEAYAPILPFEVPAVPDLVAVAFDQVAEVEVPAVAEVLAEEVAVNKFSIHFTN